MKRQEKWIGVLLGVAIAICGWANSARGNNAVPQVNKPLVPGSAQPGSPGLVLTVNGSGFAAGATVDWNGSARATTFVNSRQLTAQILAADLAAPGTASVTVVNPAPGGGTSNTVFFQVTSPASTLALAGTGVATGTGPFSVIAADFNGDGIIDLAVANETDNTVSILLGRGDGSFQASVDYPTGLGPEDLAVGDFNRDGHLDLAVVNSGENSSGQYANSVSILLGNGDGTFQTHVDYATGEIPVRVVKGDFNRDGNLDLAVVNQLLGTLSILLGNGDGTFQAHVDYGVGGQPMAMATADFNRDGILDMAVANFSTNTVSILLGNGDGTFQAAVDYSTPKQPDALLAADLNGDGILDLAVAEFGSSAVGILLGNGDGTFQKQRRYTSGPYPESIITGDFNGDGKLDLAMATNTGLGSVSTLLGNGDGTFQTVSNFPAGLLPVELAAGDFNRDGMLDLASADLNGNELSELLQTTLQLAPSSLTFASQGLGTTSSPQTVTLTNLGASSITISNIATAAPFAETNTCGSALAAGANCTVSVTFTPTETGVSNGSLTVTDSAVGSPQAVALSGTGTGGTVSLSPTSLNFGNQNVNSQSAGQMVTLTNTGNSSLTITGITTTGDYSQTNTCGTSLAAGANCNIMVYFTPTTTGTRTGVLSVADSAPDSPQSVSLTGVGIAPSVTLTPTSLTYAVQLLGTTSPSQAVTLTNNGTAALNITSITTPSSFGQTNTCGNTVNVNQSCTINVTFTPNAIGSLGGNLGVVDNAPGSPQTVALSGTGTEVSLNPATLNFGGVTLGQTSSPMSATLTNVGTTSLTINSINVSGTNSGDFTIQTNTCGASVGPGASCTVSATFTPGGTGQRTASLMFYDGGGASPQSVTLTGTGNPQGNGPVVSLNPTSLSFANQLVGTKSAALVSTLTNTGSATLNISSITISGDYSLSTTCGSTLAAGASCNISVSFKPTTTGTRTGNVTLADNATNSPQLLPLTGVGIAPAVTLSPTSLTFAVQLVGTTSPSQAVTLTNTGTAALTINQISTGNSFPETDDCPRNPSTLGAGLNCTINVSFDPTTTGSLSASVSVYDNAAGNPQKVTCTGTGTVVSLNPTSLDFGTIDLGQSSSPMTATLTNTGTTTLTINSITLSGANPGDYSVGTNTCGSTLGAGGTCSVSTVFTPTATGTRTASLTFYDNGGASPQSVSLTGTGNPTGQGPVVSLSPTSLSFANQMVGTKSAALVSTLTNTGSATLNISSIAVSGDFSYTTTCGPTVAAGASCNISVSFTPTAMGTRSGAVTIADNAANSPQSLPLSGVGIAPVVTLSPTSLTFGVQLVGTTSPSQAVTLTNTGTAALTLNQITSGTSFPETDNCPRNPNTLGVGSNCTINVSFAPTGSGVLSASLSIGDNASNSPQKVSCSGTGTAVELSPPSLDFGNVTVGQSSPPQTLTVTNTGTASINFTVIKISGTNASDFSIQTNTCGSSLGAGASCSVTTVFTPGAAGLRSASIMLYDSGGASPQSVNLTGTGD